MMKNSFQKSNFLYYAIILVSVLVEVVMIWQLERLIPLLYPGFIGFLVFHVLYHLFLFLVAKRSGRWDYLTIWGLFLMFNLLYDSFLGLLFLGLSLVCDLSLANSCYFPCLDLAFSEVFLLYESSNTFQQTCRILFLVV